MCRPQTQQQRLNSNDVPRHDHGNDDTHPQQPSSTTLAHTSHATNAPKWWQLMSSSALTPRSMPRAPTTTTHNPSPPLFLNTRTRTRCHVAHCDVAVKWTMGLDAHQHLCTIHNDTVSTTSPLPSSFLTPQLGAHNDQTSQRPHAPMSITHNDPVHTHSLPSPLLMHSQVQAGTKRLNTQHINDPWVPHSLPSYLSMTTTRCKWRRNSSPLTSTHINHPQQLLAHHHPLPLPTPHGATSPLVTQQPDDDGHHCRPSWHTSELNEAACSPHATSFLYFLVCSYENPSVKAM